VVNEISSTKEFMAKMSLDQTSFASGQSLLCWCFICHSLQITSGKQCSGRKTNSEQEQ